MPPLLYFADSTAYDEQLHSDSEYLSDSGSSSVDSTPPRTPLSDCSANIIDPWILDDSDALTPRIVDASDDAFEAAWSRALKLPLTPPISCSKDGSEFWARGTVGPTPRLTGLLAEDLDADWHRPVKLARTRRHTRGRSFDAKPLFAIPPEQSADWTCDGKLSISIQHNATYDDSDDEDNTVSNPPTTEECEKLRPDSTATFEERTRAVERHAFELLAMSARRKAKLEALEMAEELEPMTWAATEFDEQVNTLPGVLVVSEGARFFDDGFEEMLRRRVDAPTL